MSSCRDLASAMKTALDSSGDLTQLRAQLEDDIQRTLHSTVSYTSETMKLLPQRPRRPAMPPEVILINELIRQYLLYAGFRNTAEVLSTECGLPKDPISEEALRLKLPACSTFSMDRPLLLTMWATLQNKSQLSEDV